MNSEVDDLIEKHFVPTKNRSPVGPVVTGHSHSATLSNTIETALFLENAESIESAETACKGIGKVVDDGLGGNLPRAESVGCNHNPAPEDAAKGHIRLAKGGLKSEFVFSVNAHNHSTNLAIQSILNHLTPQEIVKALRKVSQNKASTKKIGLAGENLTPHEKAIEAVVKSKYSLEMGKSTEEELKVKLDDVSNRVADLSKRVDEATAYVEQLKEGIVLVEDNVKHHNFTLLLAKTQLDNCMNKLVNQKKKLRSFNLEEQAADATMEQSSGFVGINSNAVKHSTKVLTRKIHRQANALRKDINNLQHSCKRRNETYLTEKRDFTKSVVELAKLRREIRGKSLANGRHLALLHLLKVQEKLLKNKLEKAHKSVLSFQEAVVDNEARKRRLEIAYQESKINPKSKRLEQHAIETCSDIKKCGDCLSHNIDSTDGEQCGW